MDCHRYRLQITLLMILIVGAKVVELAGSALPHGKPKIQVPQPSSYAYKGQQSQTVNGGFLSSLLRKYLPVIPNTYYDIPKHRYPYYDENGTGRLLYGYGGKQLYKYTVFKPLEGYFK